MFLQYIQLYTLCSIPFSSHQLALKGIRSVVNIDTGKCLTTSKDSVCL